MTPTELAQYAAEEGPGACCRPAHDSSPDGLAFQVGLWAREHHIAVHEVKPGRGYTLVLNRTYRLNFKDTTPQVCRIAEGGAA